MSQDFGYPERCPGYPGYAKVGRVVVDLGWWTLEHTINSERSGSQRLRQSTVIPCLLSPNQSYSFSLFPSDYTHSKDRRRLVFSWFVQGVRVGLNDLDTGLTFHLHVQPDHVHSLRKHDLSLSIAFTAPDIGLGLQPDSTISWPFSFFANGIPILPEEAEEMFRVRIQMHAHRDYYRLPPDSAHRCFPELSAMCGFDPALNGVDVCDYFDWYPWEKFDEPSGGGEHRKRAHKVALFSQLMHCPGSRSIDWNSSSGIVELSESNIDNDDDPKMTLTSSDVSADKDRAIQDTIATGSVEERGSDFSTGKYSDKLSSNSLVVRQDIRLSSPHASSLQTSDSDHAHPLVSLKHSQAGHQLDRKGKRRATDKDQQRDSAEEDRFYRGRYVHRRDARTSLIGEVQTTYNQDDCDTAGIPSVRATI
ncbi:hypothetical protein ARMGADRAFT_137266 [Armillaria gallica]|uniref:Uncharacterized protein n=1 Tax=Armillaria gallica TaxID=47427 RepID=A0A2H3CBY6_ARMGA|nr:hypothetical protein ARMGADRAFT_137266 [Armillaria gallica]